MTGRPKVGDMIEAALWFNSANPQDKAQAKRGIKNALDIMAKASGMTLGEVQFEEIGPEDGRVPEPPEAYYGAPMCLFGEAVIVAVHRVAVSAFTHELEPEDLNKVRAHTRKAAAQYGEYLSDEECDEIINESGPGAAVARLREGSALH